MAGFEVITEEQAARIPSRLVQSSRKPNRLGLEISVGVPNRQWLSGFRRTRGLQQILRPCANQYVHRLRRLGLKRPKEGYATPQAEWRSLHLAKQRVTTGSSARATNKS